MRRSITTHSARFSEKNMPFASPHEIETKCISTMARRLVALGDRRESFLWQQASASGSASSCGDGDDGIWIGGGSARHRLGLRQSVHVMRRADAGAATTRKILARSVGTTAAAGGHTEVDVQIIQ